MSPQKSQYCVRDIQIDLRRMDRSFGGTGRFELPTPRTPSECSTRLSHVPTRTFNAVQGAQRTYGVNQFYTNGFGCPTLSFAKSGIQHLLTRWNILRRLRYAIAKEVRFHLLHDKI